MYRKSASSKKDSSYLPSLLVDKKQTGHKIAKFRSHLPPPLHKKMIHGVEFSIFRAKDGKSLKWTNPSLKKLVMESRRMYRYYYNDKISLLDPDDEKKTFIYLTRVTFPIDHGRSLAEKWYSVRFVPAAGDTFVNAVDLDIFTYKNGEKKSRIIDLIKKNTTIFKNESERKIKKRIVIISRFTSIAPYSLATNKIVKSKLSFAGISFALMNQAYLSDLKRTNDKTHFFITQLHKKLFKKTLSFPPNSENLLLPLKPAHETLKIQKEYLAIDRKKFGKYIYNYPGYFLNIFDLVKSLESLIQKDMIKKTTLEKYLPIELSEIKKNPKVYHFQNFNALLKKRGKIRGSKLTGAKLREYLNTHVADGPELHLIKKTMWEKGLRAFVKNVTEFPYEYVQ